MPIKHRRDVKSIKAPSKDQVDIGEIVINAKTGKLYIVSANAIFDDDGNQIGVEKQSVVEFSGKILCQTENVPDIEYSDVSDFCCLGDTLSVEVSGLDRITDYKFGMIELTANGSSITLEPAKYTNYTSGEEGASNFSLLRKAIIPININVTKEISAVSVFKFTIEIDNVVLTEKVLSIRCKDCSSTPASSSGGSSSGGSSITPEGSGSSNY